MKDLRKNFKMAGYVLKFCPAYVIWSIFYIIAMVTQAVARVYLIKAAVNAVETGEPFASTLQILLLYGVILLVTSVFRLGYADWARPHYRAKYVFSIQQVMFKKCRDVDYADFDNPDFYDAYDRALHDGTGRGYAVYNDFVNFLAQLAEVIALGTIVITSSPLLISVILVLNIVVVLINMHNNKILYLTWVRVETDARLEGYVSRVFYLEEYAAELKSTIAPDLLTKMYREASTRVNAAYKKDQGKTTLFGTLQVFISDVLLFGFVYLILAYQLVNKLLSVTQFTMTLSATLSLGSAFSSMLSFFARMQDNALFITDFLSYMAYVPKLEKGGIEKDETAFTALELAHVNFRYPGSDHLQIDDISLSVKKGERLAIVGLNGAGKTTLLKILLKFYQPEGGTILLNGDDYATVSASSVRQAYTIVFQDYQVYATSVLENILMRPVKDKEEDEKLGWQCLEKVGLDEKVRSLPEGINTEVTREFESSGAAFSGGEKQRLALSRVFASHAPVVILDEPTSALDPFAEKRVNDLVLSSDRERTWIVIAHRLSTVVGCDDIILLEKGRIKEHGTHHELMELGGRYEQMFSAQAALYQKRKEGEAVPVFDIAEERLTGEAVPHRPPRPGHGFGRGRGPR